MSKYGWAPKPVRTSLRSLILVLSATAVLVLSSVLLPIAANAATSGNLLSPGDSSQATVYDALSHVYDGAAQNVRTRTGDVPSVVATDAVQGLGEAVAGAAPPISVVSGFSVAANTPTTGTNFIVRPNGETIIVPEGASGPYPVRTGNGFQFTGGQGGHGLDPRVTGVRVMDPKTTGTYQYPNGYVSYMNVEDQAVNPLTGQTVSKADPWWHWSNLP